MLVLPSRAALAEKLKPRWRDYSDVFPGVRIKLRCLTSMELSLAENRARRALRALRENAEVLRDYGLDGEDAAGGAFNPTDPEQGLRVGLLIGAVETAIEAIEDWEGIAVEGPDGDQSKAPIDRLTLATLLLDDRIDRRLRRDIEELARVLVAEGERSGASPRGSSATAGKAPVPTSAPDAGKPTSPAAGENP